MRQRLEARGHGLSGELTLEGGEVLAGGVRIGAVVEFLDDPIEQTRVYRHRRTAGLDRDGQADFHVTLAFAAYRAVVEVDAELGLARVVQLTDAHDVRRVINPQGVDGQIHGGAAMGLGWALMEHIQLKDGLILNPTLADYLIPTVLDVPPIVSTIVEVPEPGVPYGAKGIGELPDGRGSGSHRQCAAQRDGPGTQSHSCETRRPDRAAPAGTIWRSSTLA